MSRHPRPGSFRVAVCTVTYDSAEELEDWWAALCRLHASTNRTDFRVIVVDCASSDASVARLQALSRDQPGPDLEVIASPRNLGFAGGMNRAIAATHEDDSFLLALNPDARPEPGAMAAMVNAFHAYRPTPHPAPPNESTTASPSTTAQTSTEAPSNWRVGSVTARLVRPGGTVLDACGMRWTKSWRHLDRGSNEPNDGRYRTAQEVFAGTGAGTMFLREALLDVALETANTDSHRSVEDGSAAEVFAEDFHSFREDAELGFRLQRRGWRCVYEPAATIEHRRSNTPERRRSMSATVNRHSLKNRYLLRLWHQTTGNAIRTPAAWLRDLGIFSYVLLRERESLPAYGWLWRHRHRLLERRRELQRRQTAPRERMERWFHQDGFVIEPATPARD